MHLTMKNPPTLFIFVLTLLLFSTMPLHAQTKKPALLFDIHLGGGVSAADLNDRYGNHMCVGIGTSYQLKNNHQSFGVNYSYFFGTKVKEDVLKPFRTSEEGLLIGADFLLAEIKLKERGYYFQMHYGGLIPFKNDRVTHGFKWQLGIGFLSHKIRIQDDARAVRQFNSEFNKGLDRLTNGVAFIPFLGYEYQQKNGRICFYGGFEPILGLTSSKRTWNYDTNNSEHKKERLDVLINFKVGWKLPLSTHQESQAIEY
ncbi:MAG: hypothetical protein M3Q56_03465 [Bacteroidota bacterium]|nr:hypothetical protein [Bacteroidota bacterium]